MNIQQPYKNFNNIQRAAARFGLYYLFHDFMVRHCHSSFDELDKLCYKFLSAAKYYYLKPRAKSYVLLNALTSFLSSY